jgi:hypothetical protein
MRNAADQKTGDLLPDHDLAGERPAKPTQREKNAVRAKRFKERHGVHPMTVQLPVDLYARFDEYVKKRAMDKPGTTKSTVVVKLIESQLLRKR